MSFLKTWWNRLISKEITMYSPCKLAVIWICMSFFFVVSSEQTLESLMCSYYDHNKCREDPTNCNHTIESCKPQAGKRSHCFTSHRKNGNTFEIMLEGCWLHDENCFDQTECLAKEDKEGYYFCCCEGDFCNLNVSYQHLVDYPTTPIGKTVKGHTSLVSTLLFSLLPLIGIAAIIVCGFWLYRRHKRAFDYPEPIDDSNQAKKDTILDQCVESPLLGMNGGTETCSSTELIEVKAKGRFGCVWKAQMKDRVVAVKVFPIQDQQSFITERDFYSLPQIQSHDNILLFISTEKRGSNVGMDLWLITEFHERGSLYDYLKSNLLTWQELIKIAYTMARGLAFLHDDIPATRNSAHKPAVAHRDFKSKNVLVKADLTACIADFGLALKFEPGKCVGDTHGQVGTRRYMAPEVLEGAISFNRDAFLRIDMYACGLVLWELAGRCSAIDGPVGEYRLPFEQEVGPAPTLDDIQEAVVQQKIRPKLKEQWLNHLGLYGLSDTIEECWDHDPEARLSAGCVEERLNQLMFLTDKQVSTPASTLITPPPLPNSNLNPQVPALPANNMYAREGGPHVINMDNTTTSNSTSHPQVNTGSRRMEGGHSSGYSSSFEPEQPPRYSSLEQEPPPNHTVPASDHNVTQVV